MVRLEALKRDSLVRGVTPGQQVKVVSVVAVGEDAVTIYYKDESGALQERMLFRNDEPSLEKNISPTKATPNAPPICWNACNAPEPEPASCCGTPMRMV